MEESVWTDVRGGNSQEIKVEIGDIIKEIIKEDTENLYTVTSKTYNNPSLTENYYEEEVTSTNRNGTRNYKNVLKENREGKGWPGWVLECKSNNYTVWSTSFFITNYGTIYKKFKGDDYYRFRGKPIKLQYKKPIAKGGKRKTQKRKKRSKKRKTNRKRI